MADIMSKRLEVFLALQEEQNKAASLSGEVTVTVQLPGLEEVVALPAGTSAAALLKPENFPQISAAAGALLKKFASGNAGLLDRAIATRINGELADLGTPLSGDCTLSYVSFKNDDAAAYSIYWHSAAHILGWALEANHGAQLDKGPALEKKAASGGFYYDGELAAGCYLSDADLPKLIQAAKKLINDNKNVRFERLVVSREDALKVFADCTHKKQNIMKHVAEGETCTLYRCGAFIDFCRGPHLPTVGTIVAAGYTLTSASGVEFEGVKMQRVYGIAFPTKDMLAEHLAFVAEVRSRNHRTILNNQALTFFHPASPGCAFWLPHGARLYNALLTFLRGEYRKRAHDEVMTPIMANIDMWRVSGHWAHYREDMFSFYEDQHAYTDEKMADWTAQLVQEHEAARAERALAGKELPERASFPGIGYYNPRDGMADQQTRFALKPMNCPFHVLMYKFAPRVESQLPMRLMDFGAIHRNEASGALTGLTRVRRFTQDDGHIFCTHDQIDQEIMMTFEFIKYIYSIFDFKFKLGLSTRPEKAFDNPALWEKAESQLKRVLDEFTTANDMTYHVNEGDGAFYGPKIDITLMDALGREFQCATIQLDFLLPENFDLTYLCTGAGREGQRERPVMIHRAILGSLERFIAVLAEDCKGNWPFWLAPRQAMVVSVPFSKNSAAESALVNEYARRVCDELRNKGFFADVDTSTKPLAEKVKAAMDDSAKYPVVIGVGLNEWRAAYPEASAMLDAGDAESAAKFVKTAVPAADAPVTVRVRGEARNFSPALSTVLAGVTEWRDSRAYKTFNLREFCESK